MTDLLAGLASAFAVADPVPAAVRLAAERARSGGRIDGRVLPELRGGPVMRGMAGVLDFGGLIVRTGRADGTVWLSGLVTGPVDALRAHWPDGEISVAVDDIGGFRAAGLPTGPVCLAVRRPGEPPAVTPWFTA